MRKPTAEAHRESGFIMVGVVVFVLALTILGLSLFGLSSFEAQFLTGSRNEAQALHHAIGGLERVKLALAATDSLQGAKLCEDPGIGLQYALVRPVTGVGTYGDSVGPMPWGGTNIIEIRCTGVSNGVQRTVVAHYNPKRNSGVYGNLITSRDGVTVSTVPGEPGGTYNPANNTYLDGHTFQQSPDTSYLAIIGSGYGGTREIGTTPVPDVDAYIADPGWAPSYPTVYPFDFNIDQLDLGNPGGYAHALPPFGYGPGEQVGWYFTGDLLVNVSGTAVWMFPTGGAFSDNVRVLGTPSDRLIIVAGNDGNSRSLVFKGGLHSPQGVKVILVADGSVLLEHESDWQLPGVLGWTSIWATGVFLRGGDGVDRGSGDAVISLSHDSALDNSVLNDLYDWGILPGVTGSGATFDLVVGTWREIASPDAS